MDSYVYVDFYSNLDEESRFVCLNATVSLVDLETGKSVDIGKANFHMINVFLYRDWSSVVYHADSKNGDIYNITEGLREVIENETDFLGLLVVMDRIYIEKKYRGKGYATQAIKEIIKYFKTWGCDYFALRPYPFEEKDEEIKQELVQLLVKFYKRFHFDVVQVESDTQLILGRNLNFVE